MASPDDAYRKLDEAHVLYPEEAAGELPLMGGLHKN
jgi:hypothetical protein